MNINSILSNGITGVQRGIQRTDVASGQIATKGVESPDIARNMVELRIGEKEAKAAANVIKTGDEILGSLIDIRE